MKAIRILAISLMTPLVMFQLGIVSAEGATSTRVAADRPFFKNVTEIEDVLATYGSSTIKPFQSNPANVSFHGDAWVPGSVHFSLRGLVGWQLQHSSVGAYHQCSSLPDPECEKIIRSRGYMATLPPCLSPGQSDCISRLAVTTREGDIEDALPVKKLGRTLQDMSQPGDPTGFPADSKVNLPAGGEKWLWSFPRYQHSSGGLFIPSVSLWQQVDVQSIDEPYRFPDPNVWISLSPVAPQTSGTKALDVIHSALDFELARETFVDPDLFTLEFRTSAPWTTWNKASLGDLRISFSRLGPDYVYSISGRPSQIPEVGKNILVTQTNLHQLKEFTGGNFRCRGEENDLSKCSGVIYVGGKDGIGPASFDFLERVEKLIDRKSESLTYFWLVQTSVAVPYSPEVQECSMRVVRSQPAGTVSSNATLQQDGPPIWDPKEQAFTYRVGALSKLPNGEDFKGTYTFQLSTEMAECIWGKIPTAQSLTIQILNSDGTIQLVTSSATTSGKTFVFNASGFHFSSPRIVVRSQEPALQSPSPKRSPDANAKAVRKSALCVKGKKTKSFSRTSGSKVKCPSGWKPA